jgi:hypothetical protein
LDPAVRLHRQEPLDRLLAGIKGLRTAWQGRQFAQLCLDKPPADEPFFLGYAYEAFARAESIAGNDEKAAEYLKQTRGYAEEVTDLDDKQLLVDDLKTLE